MPPTPEPTGALQALRASTADLLQSLDDLGWSDADLAAPSLCPGWTRGHVLSHLARNADAIAGTLAGALRGEVVPLYPDGPDARNAAIDAGADRPLAVVTADLRESTEKLDRVIGAVREAGAWDGTADRGRTTADWVFARLSEVEIHRLDLDAGYHPRRWPPALITRLLPQLAESVDGRTATPVRIEVDADDSVVADLAGQAWGGADRALVRAADWALLAWLAGRNELDGTPELSAWA